MTPLKKRVMRHRESLSGTIPGPDATLHPPNVQGRFGEFSDTVTRAGARVSGDRGNNGFWAMKGFIMPSNAFSEFGREVKRPFEVHENCYDCTEFHGGCMGWRASRDFACEGFSRLPNVMPGTYGQRVPASRKSERAEYQPAGRYMAPGKSYCESSSAAGGNIHTETTDLLHEIHKAKVRTCGCGAPLPKGRRLCDTCRTQNRRKAKRDYMRTYMAQWRSVEVDAGSRMLSTHSATPSTQAGGGDLVLTGLPVRGACSGQSSVLTEGVLTGGRT